MKIRWRLAIISMLFCAVAIPAQQAIHKHASGKSPSEPVWADLQASMEKMHAAMTSVEPTGNSDADFVKLMIPHHQAAIDMAKTQLLYGKDPQMRRLAQEIITDQQSEIELMKLWLKQNVRESSNVTQRRPVASKEY
jgi:uncharacterized protein (DUF305 family)